MKIEYTQSGFEEAISIYLDQQDGEGVVEMDVYSYHPRTGNTSTTISLLPKNIAIELGYKLIELAKGLEDR